MKTYSTQTNLTFYNLLKCVLRKQAFTPATMYTSYTCNWVVKPVKSK